MEEIIINKLCSFCKNKNEKINCMNYKECKQNNLIVYKCNNYARNEEKIAGYDEKWIDNAIIDITCRNTRRGARV